MNITTFQDYINFCKSLTKKQLELIEGNAISYQDFGELEAKTAIMLSIKATEELRISGDSIYSLQNLANEFFENYKNSKEA